MVNVFVVFYFIFVCVSKIVLTNGQNPYDPCPRVFRYESERSGLLTIVSQITTIQVEVKLSIGSQSLTSNARFEPLESSWESACQVIRNKGIRIRLHFPIVNPVPYIEEIKLNDKVICVGSKAPGYFVTTLNLKYGLNLNCPNSPWVPDITVSPYRITTRPPSEFHPEFNNHQDEWFPETTQKTRTTSTTTSTTINPPMKRKKIFTTFFGNDEDCGRITKATPTIVHGTIAKHSYPWLTQIYYDSKFICGGNLVSNRHVITAAHCITEVQGNRDPQNFELVFGVHNFTDSLGPDTESVVASKIFTHPLYISADTSFATHDIAIIITRRVKLTPRIKPICLFRSLPDISNFSNKIGIIAGWGKTEKNALSGVLKQAKVKIISHEECKKSDYQFRDILRERSFCAGGLNGSGPCNGDSGGGLFFEFMHQNVRRYYLRGIISSSLAIETVDERICDVEKYAVYTDVAKYENWLLEFVDSLS